jgi:hypothetical protein
MKDILLKVPRFEYFLTNGGKDLSEEILNMLVADDFIEGMSMKMFKKVYYFLKDRQSLILKRYGVHICGCDFLVPLFL